MISVKSRDILVNWLVEVHLRLELKIETLFLTINILDRYSEVTQLKPHEYQAIGVACILIASKYEEIFIPNLRDLIYFTANSCTKP